jgi:hypothetical protein
MWYDMRYTKKKIKRMKKPKSVERTFVKIEEPPRARAREYIDNPTPTILRKKWSERIKDLAALNKTEFIWCTKREQMIHVQVCYHTCIKKKHCRRYQNYINGCDRDGNSLL